MKTLALVNKKGGVGKTTFAVTSTAELERMGVLTQAEDLEEITQLRAKTPRVR
jgi:MinD-like ATPase involved in chromosome partitioning or flagellar assembly